MCCAVMAMEIIFKFISSLDLTTSKQRKTAIILKINKKEQQE